MKKFIGVFVVSMLLVVVFTIPALAKGANSIWSHREIEWDCDYDSVKDEWVWSKTTTEVNDGFIRVFDIDRFGTAFRIQTKLRESLGVEKYDTVIVAYGRNAADALSGSYLSAITKAPILIIDTFPKKDANTYYYDKSVRYITNQLNLYLKPNGTVYVLGGSSVISNNFVNSIKTGSRTVKRIFGATRYETNIAILNECNEKANSTAKSVILCDAYSFADSLSASALGIPIVLTDKKSGHLTSAQINYLKTLSPDKVYIAGGTAAVPNSIANDVYNAIGVSPKRLSGDTRYDTSLIIAKEFFKNATVAFFASGANFPDGLCGGPLAYSVSAPLILVNDNKSTVSNVTSYLKSSSIKRIGILGGTGAISSATQNTLGKSIGLSDSNLGCNITKPGTVERYLNDEIDEIEYEEGAYDIHTLFDSYIKDAEYDYDYEAEYEMISFERERGYFEGGDDTIYTFISVGQNAKRLFEFMQYELGANGINPDYIDTGLHTGGINDDSNSGVRYWAYKKVS